MIIKRDPWKHRNIIKDYIIDYLLAEENPAGMDPVLSEWLAASAANRESFERYKKIWHESRFYMGTDAFDSALAWRKIDTVNRRNGHIRKRRKHLFYLISGAAASFLAVFMLSLTGVFQKEPGVQVRMYADYGNRSEIVLPDGSLVRLNSGSEVVYTYHPERKVREVSFQGEGFFDVAKSRNPFVIKTPGGLQVKVRGTSFNLQAYPDDSVVQASLVEGSIELDCGDDNLTMSAGEMAAFDKATHRINPVKGILSHSYGWLDNKLYMEDMPLSVVCKHLERWYDVKIALPPGLGEKIRYNGVIQEETVTDVMDAHA